MAKNNDISSEFIEISTFDQWIQQVKSEVVFDRADGKSYKINIHSITAKQREEFAQEYMKYAPALPKGVDNRNESQKEADLKALSFAEDLMMLRYIEAGCMEVPGETLEEKIANLNKAIAGDTKKIYVAIADLSNLNDNNVSFFRKQAPARNN